MRAATAVEAIEALARQRDEALDLARAARDLQRDALAVVTRQRDLAEAALTRVETERLEALQERDHLREVIEFVLTEHHLGYCTLRADTLTILWTAVCKKEEALHG